MKVLLKIILFIFIFNILFYFIIRDTYKNKFIQLKYWKNKYSKHHNELLEHLKNVIPFLEKWKVRFWAYGGTLLGCIRHGDIIPWDDDIDLGYIDDENINNLIYDLENNNFIFGECSFGFKIFNKDNKDIFIDMFKFTKENDMLILPTEAKKIWPNEDYYYDMVFPLKIKKFNNIDLPVPNDLYSFCKKAFSKNYMDVYRIHPSHSGKYSDIIEELGFMSNLNNKFYIKDLID